MRVKGNDILPKILSTAANFTVSMTISTGGKNSRSVHQAFRKFDELQRISDEQLRQTVRYALDKKYITVTHKAGKDTLALTKAGKKLAGRYAIAELVIAHAKTWDKKWRVVLFDIPEDLKNSRDGFAANLKRIGMVQVQKSAFAHPYPCFEEIEVLADFHNVQSYITYIVANSLEPNKILRKIFNVPR